MNRHHIEETSRKLIKLIWDNQETLWPNQQLTPIQMLCPKAAAQVLGLEYLELESLQSELFSHAGKKHVIAGLIDPQAKKIAVSMEFPEKTVRFTGAHEIGHWLLHPNQSLHRDRPIDGSSSTNSALPLTEREANYFAACFLMPRYLLQEKFQGTFQSGLPYVIDDTVAFYLNPNDPDSLLSAPKNSLEREFALAKCTSLDSSPFYSLSQQFRVSDSAMARRIKELDFIRWP